MFKQLNACPLSLSDSIMVIFHCVYYTLTTYVFHGRVTLFFANNSLMQCRITMKFLHNFFLKHEVFLRSHTMFIDTSTKEFTLVNCSLKPWYRNRTLSILQDGCQCLLRTR